MEPNSAGSIALSEHHPGGSAVAANQRLVGVRADDPMNSQGGVLPSDPQGGSNFP